MSGSEDRDSCRGGGKGDDRSRESKCCRRRQVAVGRRPLSGDGNKRPGGVLDRDAGRGEGRGWRQLWKTHLGAGGNRGIDGELSLSEVVLEVVEDPDSHGVFHVETLNVGHVAGDLGHALTKAHHSVIKEGAGVGVSRERISKTCR